MTYRERIAYLYLSAMLLCFGPYFIYVAFNPNFYDFGIFDKIKILAPFAIANMIIVALGHLYFYKTIPKTERIAFDERDRDIDANATRIAYHTLIYCALFVGCYMPFFSSPWKIVNTTIFVVVIAETIRGLKIIMNYRKQRV